MRAAACAALLVAVLAGCGTASPDLFVVERRGTVPGAQLTMLVSDQTVRCNDGAARPLTSEQIITARELNKDLLKLQSEKQPLPKFGPAQIFSFSVRTEEGTLTYPDVAQRPEILPRVTLFVRRTAIDTCRLKR